MDSGSSAGAERRRSRKIRPGVQEVGISGENSGERNEKQGAGAGQQNNAVSDVLSAVRQQQCSQWSGDRSRPGVSHMPPSVPRTQARQRHFRKTKVFILNSYGWNGVILK